MKKWMLLPVLVLGCRGTDWRGKAVDMAKCELLVETVTLCEWPVPPEPCNQPCYDGDVTDLCCCSQSYPDCAERADRMSSGCVAGEEEP